GAVPGGCDSKETARDEQLLDAATRAIPHRPRGVEDQGPGPAQPDRTRVVRAAAVVVLGATFPWKPALQRGDRPAAAIRGERRRHAARAERPRSPTRSLENRLRGGRRYAPATCATCSGAESDGPGPQLPPRASTGTGSCSDRLRPKSGTIRSDRRP